MKLFVFNKYIFNIVAILLLSALPTTLFAEEVLYYHTDNFGTPMAMTNESGKVVWRADELPFGEEYQTEELPARNDRRFLGKELDRETGLICIGARYLDPKTGRFTQPDPVGLVDPATGKVNQEMLVNPQRQNRYIYGLNNPYKYIDPDGNSPLHILLAAGALLVTNPDAGNAPGPADTPVESHGARNMAVEAAGAVALGVGGKAVSKVVGKRTGDFFKGTRYTGKVKRQMQQGDLHSFPESVKGFQDAGKVSRIRGGDGIVREKLEIPGGYRGREGKFEFIKESNGNINHRLFKAKRK